MQQDLQVLVVEPTAATYHLSKVNKYHLMGQCNNG
jgi:hypothetical protein